MELPEVLPGVPEDPDVSHHVDVQKEDEVETPPDLKNQFNSQLLVEDLYDHVEDLVEPAEEEEEAGDGGVGLDVQEMTAVGLYGEPVGDPESSSSAGQGGTGQQDVLQRAELLTN